MARRTDAPQSPTDRILADLRERGATGAFAFQIAAATSLGITKVVALLTQLHESGKVQIVRSDDVLTRWALARRGW